MVLGAFLRKTHWTLLRFVGVCLTCLVAAITAAKGQETVRYDRIPHFTITPHLNLNGMGYQTFSQSISSGIHFEGVRFVLDSQVSYDNARKVNDGTGSNPHGHSRGIAGTAFLRLPNGWLAGVRADWAETLTTNYRKSAWRPSFGAAKDLVFDDWSCRLTALYTLPYTDHVNGLQGPRLGFIMPSPATKHHFYFTEDLLVGILHATVTDPKSKSLTEMQIHDRAHSANLSFGLMFKF